MTRYVVVSAVRITDWLTRTPRLRYLRGASAVLNLRTDADAVRAGLDLAPCDEAGRVAGVVAVEIADDQDPSMVADRIAARLAEQLPAVEWEAWWADSDRGYVDAFTQSEAAALAGSTSGGVGRRTYLPQMLDVPLAQTCDGCRRETADAANTLTGPDGETVRLGPDCRVRHDPSPKTKGDDGEAGRAADDFAELARLGGVTAGRRSEGSLGRKESRNHLATIHADGNGVGAFMGALAVASGARPDSTLAELRKTVVTAIDFATTKAVEDANRAICVDAQQVRPYITHYVGGDDILVSVPAPVAWRYVLELAAAFEAHLHERLVTPFRDALTDSMVSAAARLSMGFGITFAHASHPFADARALAFTAMKQAKKRVWGREAVVSWIDLTVEDRLPDTRFITMTEIGSDMASRPALFDLGPSARAVLGEILRDFWPDPAQSQESGRTRIEAWATRTQHDHFAAQFAANPDLGRLRDLLSRARWWPNSDGAKR